MSVLNRTRKIKVLQIRGTSTKDVMSQDAVTKELVIVDGKITAISNRVTNLEQSDFAAIAESFHAYGVRIDSSFSSTVVPRIGNVTKQKTLPIQANMKACLLKDDGTVNYYLNPSDWTKRDTGAASNLTGVDGQVMIEIPKFYYKAVTVSPTIFDLTISAEAILGFTLIPKQYVGAYKATVNRTNSKLSSVVNITADYRGGNNNATLDLLSSTQLGKPATDISLTTFRTYARNRGARFSPIYYDLRKWLYWLFVTEYANLNSQSAVTAKDVNGYAQGGLGDGFTTANSTEWGLFNNYYPACPCGVTNSLGNGSGEVNFTVNNFGGAGINRTFKANRYRGIENPFGDIWEWTDGILIDVKTDGDGGTSTMYTSSTPVDFSSSSFANYVNRGQVARLDGFIKIAKLGVNADILPTNTVGGGSTTYFADYYYNSIASSVLRGVLFGGTANNGATAGFVCANTYNAPSAAHTNVGSRLCFV